MLKFIKRYSWHAATGFGASALSATLISGSFPGRGSNSLLFKLTGIGDQKMIAFAFIPLLFLLAASFLSSILHEPTRNDFQQTLVVCKNQRSQLALAAISFSAFTALSFLVFHKYQASLFSDVDGNYMIALAHSQRHWNTTPHNLGSNFLQGLGGNINFPVNTNIDLGYLLGMTTGSLDFSSSHYVWALLLFGSTLLLCISINLPFLVATLSAWLSAVLILFPIQSRFYAVASLIPHIASTISASSLLLSLILVEVSHKVWQALRASLIVIVSLYIFFSSPTMSLLILPLISLFCVLKLATSESRSAFRSELIIYLASASLLVLLGSFNFFLGLLLNSASTVFKDEFIIDRGHLQFASTLFTGHGLISVPAAVLGLLALSFNKYSSHNQKLAGRASLIYGSIILFSGLINWKAPQFWKLPSPVYFEFFLWPLYCIGIAYFAYSIVFGIFSAATKHFNSHFDHHLNPLVVLRILPFATLFAFLFVNLKQSPPGMAWKFPPPQAEIMDKVRNDLKYEPNTSYKGRLATFTGLNIDHNVNWSDLQLFDYELLDHIDNDMRKAGFWLDSIPTLTEYNPHITPRYYFFATRLLGRQGDKQVRSMMTLRNPDLKVLSAMGITHLITDSNAALINKPAVELAAVEPRAKLPVYLYRLTGANLTGFSPVKIFKHETVSDLIDSINSPEFDFKSMIAIEESLGDIPSLTSVKNSRILVERNSYRITASSSGYSILMLPIEYSSCFELTNHLKSSSSPKVFPGNGLFMSILFEKNLDLSLHYTNSPLQNQNCRLDDYFGFISNLGKFNAVGY